MPCLSKCQCLPEELAHDVEDQNYSDEAKAGGDRNRGAADGKLAKPAARERARCVHFDAGSVLSEHTEEAAVVVGRGPGSAFRNVSRSTMRGNDGDVRPANHRSRTASALGVM